MSWKTPALTPSKVSQYFLLGSNSGHGASSYNTDDVTSDETVEVAEVDDEGAESEVCKWRRFRSGVGGAELGILGRRAYVGLPSVASSSEISMIRLRVTQ